MADYEHSSNFHKIAAKIKETNNLKDIDTLRTKLEVLEQDDEVRELIGKCDEREKEIKELIKEEKYQKAVSGYDVERDNLEDQIKSFKELIGFKDSEKYFGTLIKEKEYRELVRIFDSGNCDWEYVSKGFEKLGDYKDSRKYYESCQPKIEEQQKEKELREKKKREEELEKKYQEASTSMDKDKYDYASMLFKNLGDFKDSKQKAEECDKRIADTLEKKQKAEAKKKKTIILVVLALFIAGLASYLIINLLTWQSDDYVHWHSVFGSTVSYTEHDFELIADVPPTCTENGYRKYECKECGRLKYETINPTGHLFDDGVITKEPTCTENGVKTYTCKVCGTVKTETIPATGHDYSSENCSRCGKKVLYKIGERGPAGGFIFYNCDDDNDTGNKDGLKSSECGWRYLEAAPSDIGSYIFGYYETSDNGNNIQRSGTARGIGFGKLNTKTLVSDMGAAVYNTIRGASKTGDYAARLCDSYSYGGYSDWFLPSKDELNLMYMNLQKAGLGGFADDYYYSGYWSSSEANASASYAWFQYFDNGGQSYDDRNLKYRVRPVRAF